MTQDEVEKIACDIIYKKCDQGGNFLFIKKKIDHASTSYNLEFFRHDNVWDIDRTLLNEYGIPYIAVQGVIHELNDIHIQKSVEITNDSSYIELYASYEDADELGYYEKTSPEYVRVHDVLQNVVPRSTVYDVACNSGGIGKILIDERQCEVYGSDLCPELVQKACDKGINAVCCFAEDVPFKDRSFDHVIMSFVLEHVRDPDLLMRESLRTLKNGGTLLGCVPTEYGDWGRHTIAYHPEHLRAYDKNELSDLFDRHGLINTSIFEEYLVGRDIADYYFFVAQKPI